jgi:5'-3' exonuclease
VQAQDLGDMERFKLQFELSKPFSPIEQLMGVLPAARCGPLRPGVACRWSRTR